MNREIESKSLRYGGLSIPELAEMAKVRARTSHEEQKPISTKSAVALVIRDKGRELLKESLRALKEHNVAPDINSVVRGLSKEAEITFAFGLGGVIFGSIVKSLEEAVIEGWDDRQFIANFNLTITGTPFPKIDERDYISKMASEHSGQNNSMQEAAAIRQALIKDNTFLSFFVNPITSIPNRENLPESVRNFLKQNEYMDTSIGLVLPYYREAIKLIPQSSKSFPSLKN